ncbi:MAG: glycosyltransferase family 4 protein [Pseudomonadaceae bacterium]|nr:glycosyltransferase family 4 protein [Pseudomonadaceae bacterium]
MKLLYCAGSTIPSDSANSIHVMRMGEALSELGHDVTVIAKEGAGTDPFRHYGVAANFELVTVPFTRRTHITRYLAAARAIGPVDALIGRYIYPIWLLRSMARQFTYESHQPPSGLRSRIEAQLLRDPRCAGVPLISNALLELYEKRFGARATNPCFVLPDAAVDSGAVTPPRSDGRLQVGYAGSDYAGRGLDVILYCARALPQCDFIIAGATQESLAQQYGALPDNLTCVGRLPHAAVANFLRNCDVLLAPYQRSVAVSGNAGNTIDWCSPLKLFEYLAQGKAIVVSNLPALREIMNTGNAVLVDAEDLPGWVNALTRLDADRSAAMKLGAQARADFTSSYTWKIRASKLVDRFA